ncbi:PIN domain-containing protein [Sulfitobacter pontiacus]|jgi:hypothetical protein|uniref:HTH domain-containing protein n=1 Tax=Sulfitobacter pontiacus TaxID=60137 RepID=UPI00241E1950|nr:hypothetical protein [Sulfitobacter pontiacus]HJO52848.1 hypothetical protein [Sulfitobacter pontiacus]|tara:strand:+ start:2379 stop:6779 length:4401 start_codon:yes stop_codon:yes gene_type:complete
MADFVETKALEQELERVSRALDVETGAHKAPLNSLSDSDFELLLWCLYKQKSGTSGYYDTATLMVAGADGGRDVWLTKNGNPAGLVQCKKLKAAFSRPAALREIIKFILFAELDSSLLKNELPFKYSLAVSTDPTKTTVDYFTSPSEWLENSDDKVSSYLDEVIRNYESFKGFTVADKLDRVKLQLKTLSYELIRPSDIDAMLDEHPHLKKRFFRVRLVQSEEKIEEYFERIAGEHRIVRPVSDKDRGVLDEALQGEIEELRKSRFFPGSDTTALALRMFKQLKDGDFREGSAQVRSKAFGACGRWLSRSEENEAAEEAIRQSKALGECNDAIIAQAFLTEPNNWTECLIALAPLDNSEKVTAALIAVKHSTNSEQALQWFHDADFAPTDVDADGKVVLLSCQFDAQNWDAAYSLAVSLQEDDFAEAPALFHLAGLACILSVLPEEFRDAFQNTVPFVRHQFPLWDDPESMQQRKTAAGFFRRASEAAAEFGLDAKHTYENYALWLELHDPDEHGVALERLALLLSDAETAIHFIPLGLGFIPKIDRNKVEHVLSRQEARCPGGNFEVAFARFVMAISISDPAQALAYFETHRIVIESHLNTEAYLDFEVRACVQAGRTKLAMDAVERNSEKLSAKQKDQFFLVISQGKMGPDLRDLETTYSENPSTLNLKNLVNQLGQQGFSDRLFELTRKLIEDTRSITETERAVRFLFANDMHEEVEIMLSDVSNLVQTSLELRFAKAWTQFRNGNFEESLKAIVQLRNERDDQNDRNLHQKLLIASGRWEELTVFVEEEWKNREHRTPEELYVLAQLSGAIDSPRLGALLEIAAKAGEDNPSILLGCYMTATERGLEDGPKVFGWLDRAFKLSGEDGPVQKRSIEDVANEMPDWNERIDEVWDSYRKGELPLSMVAAQLRRSSLEMQISSIVLNRKQSDPRKRNIVSAYSGVHGEIEVDLKRVGLESTAIVTLASLNILEEVMRQYDEILIPHSTLDWLFSERRKLAFHQPSRVKRARALLTALTTGKVHEYNASLAPDAELATLVDKELAEMLTSAKADDSEAKAIVVRSAPVHKISSLMDEIVDLTDYNTCLCSCQAVIDKMVNLGSLMPEDEQQARIFLERSEQRWPDELQVEDGANLFLDDLSVSYFQTTNLLTSLADAGFKVFVPKRAIRVANALVEMDGHAEDFERIIGGIRKALSVGISEGKVHVDKIFCDDHLKSHPNVAVLQLAGQVEGLVSDDRYLNQYQHVGETDAQTPILTSLDLLADLNRKGTLSNEKLRHCRSYLRRAGYLLFPTCQDELLQFLEDTQVKNSTLVETADLKAFRENILLTLMRSWLVLTKEMTWFEKFRNSLVSALVMQWKPGIDDDVARVRSRWIFQLLDLRNWAGSITGNDGFGLAENGLGIICNSLALRGRDIQDEESADRYSKWLKEEVFDTLQFSDPAVYAWLLKSYEQMVLSNLASQGGLDG